MRSPLAVGMVETRTSTTLPAIFLVMRPSCGRRFSAMLRPASIFTRATMDGRKPRWASSGAPACRRCGSAPPPCRRSARCGCRTRARARREEEVVHPADDRRLVGHVDDVLQLLGVAVLLGLGQRRLVAALVDAVDGVVDGHGRHRDGLHPPAQQRAQVVERAGSMGSATATCTRPASLAHGHHPVLAREGDGHQRDQGLRARCPPRSRAGRPCPSRRPAPSPAPLLPRSVPRAAAP
jgi:hypothetical protein